MIDSPNHPAGFVAICSETGRIEYVYDIDDIIKLVKKTNSNILIQRDRNKTKTECEQIIKIINSQYKSISNMYVVYYLITRRSFSSNTFNY